MSSKGELDIRTFLYRRKMRRIYEMQRLAGKGQFEERLRIAVEVLLLHIKQGREFDVRQAGVSDALKHYRKKALANKIRCAVFDIDVLTELVVQELKLE